MGARACALACRDREALASAPSAGCATPPLATSAQAIHSATARRLAPRPASGVDWRKHAGQGQATRDPRHLGAVRGKSYGIGTASTTTTLLSPVRPADTRSPCATSPLAEADAEATETEEADGIALATGTHEQVAVATGVG